MSISSDGIFLYGFCYQDEGGEDPLSLVVGDDDDGFHRQALRLGRKVSGIHVSVGAAAPPS